jgi:hypothetical protein
LLANYPNLLAGNQINDSEPRKWLLISREAALAKDNLQAGKIRMLFVADEIPKELRRIVEFLLEQLFLSMKRSAENC